MPVGCSLGLGLVLADFLYVVRTRNTTYTGKIKEAFGSSAIHPARSIPVKH